MGCSQSSEIEVSAPTFMDEVGSAPTSMAPKSEPRSIPETKIQPEVEPIVVAAPPPRYIIEEETVFENGAVHYVILGPNELVIKKRYSDFKVLHAALVTDGRELPEMPDVTLWSALSRHNGQLISDRRQRFQEIIDCVAANHHDTSAMQAFTAGGRSI
ncbi:hypothetical protein ACHHYP_03867 [Achlya hypogyna]|uniref:PX domain-containing protein n=1 Tax=Achlya hypogyna TaxID=1202772 RepID=A0A1V9Z2N5_ACHHY|nr:hypothetical protein ACHHYP_03867 [Achlya hypogyna]